MATPKDKKKQDKKPLIAIAEAIVDPQLDLEARRTRLKALIVLGKERGYLTYAEINDHLPDMLEVEQIEGVASMINDMGIKVCDVAPDAEAMIMTDAAPAVADDDAAEEAEAALTTVDSEFGRTTDPVRMYMREMGTVDLLTREKEIEIAKRIEEGLKHMIQAISACPATIAEILALASKIEKDEFKVDDLIDGFVDLEAEAAAASMAAASEQEAAEAENGETEAEEEEDEAASAAAVAANLAQLKADALERFAVIADLFTKMGKSYEKYGYRSKQYDKYQSGISEMLMNFRFSAKQVDALCDTMRGLVEEVRRSERAIQELCVNKAKMPRPHFIKVFPGN
jgi:RNA polymerase primary sigma factor